MCLRLPATSLVSVHEAYLRTPFFSLFIFLHIRTPPCLGLLLKHHSTSIILSVLVAHAPGSYIFPVAKTTQSMPQRSKTGCTTCRERKVKCDERRPICNTCHRLTLSCSWIPQIRKQRTMRTPKQTKSPNQPAHGSAYPRPIRPKVLLSHPSRLGILGAPVIA